MRMRSGQVRSTSIYIGLDFGASPAAPPPKKSGNAHAFIRFYHIFSHPKIWVCPPNILDKSTPMSTYFTVHRVGTLFIMSYIGIHIGCLKNLCWVSRTYRA